MSDTITVELPICDAEEIQASEYANTRIADALAAHRAKHNPLSLPWCSTRSPAHRAYLVLSASGVTIAELSDLAFGDEAQAAADLVAAAPDLAAALRDAVSSQTPWTTDWYDAAVAALKKAGRL